MSDALYIFASFVCLPSKYLERHLFTQIEELIEVTEEEEEEVSSFWMTLKKKKEY